MGISQLIHPSQASMRLPRITISSIQESCSFIGGGSIRISREETKFKVCILVTLLHKISMKLSRQSLTIKLLERI